jgi:hypothetical protein
MAKAADGTLPILQQQQNDELLNETEMASEDFDEYRSHLARLKTEADFDAKELEELDDDTTKVISDWKMKILACYFRENQGKFFGKRGTSLLGYMLITNSSDPEARENGLKEVKMIMLVTDDSLQCEHAVACTKNFIYANHVKTPKAKYQSDGAGCFSSKLNRILQPFWEDWTGVREVEFRISVRGGGKTALDGAFGKMNQVVRSAVNAGASHWNAETYKGAFEDSGGLTATSLFVVAPDRKKRMYGNMRGVSMESVLRTVLDPQDMSLQAYQHSDYGEGFEIAQSNMFVFDEKNPSRKLPKIKTPAGSVVMVRCIANHIIGFLGFRSSDLASMILYRIKCPIYASRTRALMKRIPRLLDEKSLLVRARKHRKEDLLSQKARGGEGANHPDQRLKRKFTRVEAKKQKHETQETEKRIKKRANGLLLCEARCQSTGKRCTFETRMKHCYEKHIRSGKHSFRKGIDALSLAAIQASKPGGLMAVGSRPDRKSNNVFVTLEEADADTLALDDARCFGKLNRKEGKDPYHKPKVLFDAMKELFMIGSDGSERKINGQDMRDRLKMELDPVDGGLKFCRAKRGTFPRKQYCHMCENNPCVCNGMCPPKWMCDQFITTQTQARKKNNKSADPAQE